MRRVLREPLVHFVALGLLLFLWFEWRGGRSGSHRVVVTPGQIQHLAAGFARTWQRPPGDTELKALVDEYVKEELAAREAVAEGLDRDDPIVRKRLRQRLEFLAEDAAEAGAPTDAELQAWLTAHPDAFREEPRIALRQVFVSRERRGAAARGQAERLLARLRAEGAKADAATLGDPTALPHELPPGPLREVGLAFGEGFARAVEAAPPGEWTGPVESGYGLHLVLVLERAAAAPPELAAVRPQVERELVVERRRRALEALYQRLLARYSVIIERPPTPSQ